ncbi:MAG TPA: response regulator [Desulfobacteraceae bacterium]|nr:response regulator [Desulfobacteraceae bacterium]
MKTKVLLVDDEQEFVEALAQRLELRNYSVTTAFSGETAVEIAEKTEFDVVILDVLMPGMSGIEALKRIKAINPTLPVVMLTGKATVSNAIEGMKLGALDFLMKPADTGLLVEKIDQAHDIKKAHDERIRQAEIKHILGTRGW